MAENTEKTTLRISRHDQLQLELKVSYPTSEQAKSNHQLDLWFYLPPASGIGAGNYSASDFYQDLRSYTRMTIPVISMKNVIHNGEGSPFASLKMIENLIGVSGPTKKQQKRIRREARLLSCIFHRILNRKIAVYLQNSDEQDIFTFIDHIQKLINHWRETQQRFQRFKLKRKTLRALQYVDETISIYTQEYCVHMLAHLSDDHEDLKEIFLSLATQEKQHRKDTFSLSVLEPDSDGVEYLIRQSNLKKYVTSVFFLESVDDRLSNWMRHIALSFAAGLAMSWAILAQVFVYFQLGIELDQSMSIPIFALFSLFAIFSYVLKDRIKATSGLYLSKWVAKWLHDRKHMYFMADENALMAESSERMGFIHAEKAPKKLRKKWPLMEKSNLSIMVGGEILWYHRTMNIHNRHARANFSRFHGISDILRFHLWRWVRTFDDPQKTILSLHKNEVISQDLNRQYIIELIARITDHKGDSLWFLARIHVNRKGIIAVENIAMDE